MKISCPARDWQNDRESVFLQLERIKMGVTPLDTFLVRGYMTNARIDYVKVTVIDASVTVKPGADAIFSVVATGEALNYQWWCEARRGTAKAGINGPTYTIKDVNVSDNNGIAYYCVVGNKAGEVTSDKARLTVSELGTVTVFSDVLEGAYYTDAMTWAVEKGVASGTSGVTFSPNADDIRAQIVAFL